VDCDLLSSIDKINYLREAPDKLHPSFCIELKFQIRDVTTIKSNSQDSSLPIVNENALPIVNEILTMFHSISSHSNKKKILHIIIFYLRAKGSRAQSYSSRSFVSCSFPLIYIPILRKIHFFRSSLNRSSTRWGWQWSWVYCHSAVFLARLLQT